MLQATLEVGRKGLVQPDRGIWGQKEEKPELPFWHQEEAPCPKGRFLRGTEPKPSRALRAIST